MQKNLFSINWGLWIKIHCALFDLILSQFVKICWTNMIKCKRKRAEQDCSGPSMSTYNSPFFSFTFNGDLLNFDQTILSFSLFGYFILPRNAIPTKHLQRFVQMKIIPGIVAALELGILKYTRIFIILWAFFFNVSEIKLIRQWNLFVRRS